MKIENVNKQLKTSFFRLHPASGIFMVYNEARQQKIVW